jgi:VRR-NUC domain-containing protein
MPRGSARLPLQPLLAYAYHHGASHDKTKLATWLGYKRRSLERWLLDGSISLDTADEIATRNGRHPSEIWGQEYWDVAGSEEAKVQENGALRRTWASKQEGSPLGNVSEKDFMATVKDLAKLNGWLVYHTYDSRRSDPGFPDLVLVRAPRVIFAELKSAKGPPTKNQRVWLEELGFCSGVERYLWRPFDWEEITQKLARNTKRRSA